jgi:hypothetical protein
MSTTNYWNQLSGDSQASPFNQENWGGGNGFMQNMNNDRSKTQQNWGAQGFSDAGVGYWSGGSPGAGSWMEQMQAAAPVKPAAAPSPATDMVPGANAQTPNSNAPKVAEAPKSTAYAGPWDYANFDWQAYANANPDVIGTNYGGGNTWGNALDQMWHHYTSANQSGENRPYIGYQDGRISPYTGIAQNSGSYVGPAASNWSARVAQPVAPSPVTNPWISGGGSSRMNIRQY